MSWGFANLDNRRCSPRIICVSGVRRHRNPVNGQLGLGYPIHIHGQAEPDVKPQILMISFADPCRRIAWHVRIERFLGGTSGPSHHTQATRLESSESKLAKKLTTLTATICQRRSQLAEKDEGFRTLRSV